ncbi:MAG: hypothetical protein GPOALKHO_000036 [Sodalis sp.]|nr:MAG: hypothetical protein GPOALKHO_000036 [Sodalis sp.]
MSTLKGKGTGLEQLLYIADKLLSVRNMNTWSPCSIRLFRRGLQWRNSDVDNAVLH